MPMVVATSLLDESMTSVLDSAFTAVQTDVTTMVGKALPAGLAIMGLFLAIRLGVGFFRSVAH